MLAGEAGLGVRHDWDLMRCVTWSNEADCSALLSPYL